MNVTKSQRELMYLKRRNKSIKLKQIAEHLGTSIVWVSNLERGKSKFPSDTWDSYCSFIKQYRGEEE